MWILLDKEEGQVLEFDSRKDAREHKKSVGRDGVFSGPFPKEKAEPSAARSKLRPSKESKVRRPIAPPPAEPPEVEEDYEVAPGEFFRGYNGKGKPVYDVQDPMVFARPAPIPDAELEPAINHKTMAKIEDRLSLLKDNVFHALNYARDLAQLIDNVKRGKQ